MRNLHIKFISVQGFITIRLNKLGSNISQTSSICRYHLPYSC